MVETLDVINTIRVDDIAKSNTNRDMQYDLDRRAERLAKRTNVQPLDWDEFNQRNPGKQPESGLAHAVRWGVKSAALMLAVAAVGAAVIALTGGGAGLLAIGASKLALGAAAVGGIGFLSGATMSMVDDQKPELRHDQLKSYERYLNTFEKEHAVARAPEQTQVDGPSSKWQDTVNAGKDAVRTR